MTDPRNAADWEGFCWGGGGGGPKNPKVCVPKIAQINISLCKFHFSCHEIWV